MIDFGALVLGPAMTAFAQPIMVTPTKSQPGAPAYAARGSYSSKPVMIPLEGSDDFHRSQQIALGISLSEFAVRPKQGDAIVMAQGAFEIYDVELDGQGGADLLLRETDRA